VSRTKSILLVEDDQALRRILARTLSAIGYLVFEAGTFSEAREQMAVKPALLILDITLPDATGWDVANFLELLTNPVPIILISGSTPEAKQLRRFHPVAFLPKPFSVEELLAVVKEHLARPTTTYGI